MLTKPTNLSLRLIIIKENDIITTNMTKRDKTIIIVNKKSNNLRLDIFLAKKLQLTRSRAQKMILDGLITVRDRYPKKAGDRVKENDKIKINEGHKQEMNNKKLINKPTNKQRGGGKRCKINIEIITEDPDYLVINKPSGLLTHPTLANEPMSVASILAKKYPEIKKVGEDPLLISPLLSERKKSLAPNRPGIIHRLDKEASGLLVVTRTQKMFEHLKQQFKNREIEKEYLVLVHGKVNKDWDEINFPIKRTKNSGRIAAIPKIKRGIITEEGREALTEFTVEKRLVNFTLLRVKIHTGRTHQIRAHLLAYNHPVVGDPIYYQKKQKRKWDEKCGRLFLHCCKLGFVDLENNKKKFEIILPNELNNFLKEIK